MKRLSIPIALALLLGAGLATPDVDHPSEASRVLATRAPELEAERTAEARAAAARRFLESLDEEQRSRVALALDSPARRAWTNLPPGAREDGLRFGELSAEQLGRALELLAASLSRAGYQKARDIMLADDRLLRDGAPRLGFGVEHFWLALFGEPSEQAPWALQLDGHHLALNLAFEGERVVQSPSFLGAQPARFERDGERVAPLSATEDAAFALMAALSAEQRDQAVVGAARGDLAAGAGRDGVVPEREGLDCGTLDEAQRAKLLALVASFVRDLPEPSASRRLAALERELGRMVLAWRGPTTGPADVSWRVQGPALILEYACQDLGGEPLQHLHAIVRDPTNEYGVASGR